MHILKKAHKIYKGLLVLKDSLIIFIYIEVYKQCLAIYNYLSKPIFAIWQQHVLRKKHFPGIPSEC